jgi:hypothetical protein
MPDRRMVVERRACRPLIRLFHPQDASLMVLVWQVGTVFVLTTVAGSTGRLLLDWRFLTRDLHQRINIRSRSATAMWPKPEA